MTKKGRAALRRFRRVQEFLTTNSVAGTTVKMQALGQVIQELSATGEEHDATTRVSRGETARQRMLREALWNEHMVPIARIARRALGREGLDVKFLLPRKSGDNEAILDAARGMAQVAEEHSVVFIQQEGLPADFVQQFRSAIEALATALTVRVESLRRKSTSGEAVTKLVKRGAAILEVLDAIVAPKLAGQSDLLATWKLVKKPMEIGGGGSAVVEADITPVVKVA
jgi:hypothetical protein